jgi:hypothetical protein
MKHRSNGLSPSLEHRLNLYTLAASAAGVSMLALVQPAEARIVYTHTHQVLNVGAPYELDLNNDGTADFILSNDYRNQSGGTAAVMRVNAPKGNGFAVSAAREYALALSKGAKINGRRLFDSGFGVMEVVSTSTHGNERSKGNWRDAANRYLGLKFSLAGETHYGWARLTVHATADPAHITATLTGYAYETIANKPIIAGRTKGPDVMPVEPASLGHLARGASATSAWRTTKSVAPTN